MLDYAFSLSVVLELEGRILDSSGEEMARYALSPAFEQRYAKCWHSQSNISQTSKSSLHSFLLGTPSMKIKLKVSYD